MIRIYIFLAILLSVFSCHRKPLEELVIKHSTALIPIKIDWSESGIHVDSASINIGDEDFVQKVSLRFFPTDGSRPFECYLEGQTEEHGRNSIYGGVIHVPIGEYEVLAMNETVLEQNQYWSKFYNFKNIDNYASISAHTLATSYDFTEPPYDFYAPYKLPDEQFHVPAHKIASWRMDNFEVTEDLVEFSHSPLTSAQVDSLTLEVLMRRLFVNINISVDVENINALYQMRGVIKSLSSSKNLTTTVRGEQPSSIMFRFDHKKPVSNETITGTKKHTVRSFGPHIYSDPNERYLLYLDVIMVNGKRYEDQDMVFDITEEIKEKIDSLEIDIELPLIKLPIAIIDPSLDDWEDDDAESNTEGTYLNVMSTSLGIFDKVDTRIYYSTDHTPDSEVTAIYEKVGDPNITGGLDKGPDASGTNFIFPATNLSSGEYIVTITAGDRLTRKIKVIITIEGKVIISLLDWDDSDAEGNTEGTYLNVMSTSLGIFDKVDTRIYYSTDHTPDSEVTAIYEKVGDANVTGDLVKGPNASGPNFIFPAESLSSGEYIVTITAGDRLTRKIKVIISIEGKVIISLLDWDDSDAEGNTEGTYLNVMSTSLGIFDKIDARIYYSTDHNPDSEVTAIYEKIGDANITGTLDKGPNASGTNFIFPATSLSSGEYIVTITAGDRLTRKIKVIITIDGKVVISLLDWDDSDAEGNTEGTYLNVMSTSLGIFDNADARIYYSTDHNPDSEVTATYEKVGDANITGDLVKGPNASGTNFIFPATSLPTGEYIVTITAGDRLTRKIKVTITITGKIVIILLDWDDGEVEGNTEGTFLNVTNTSLGIFESIDVLIYYSTDHEPDSEVTAIYEKVGDPNVTGDLEKGHNANGTNFIFPTTSLSSGEYIVTITAGDHLTRKIKVTITITGKVVISLLDWDDSDIDGNTEGTELIVSHHQVTISAGESVNVFYTTDAAVVTPTVIDNDHIQVSHAPGKITLTADSDIPAPSVATLAIQADLTLKQIRINIK